MVNYPFDDEQNEDPIEQKSRIKDISCFAILRNLLFTSLLGCNIFYTQYLLFYQNPTIEQTPPKFHIAMIIIHITSYMIKSMISTRIFIVNQVIKNEIVYMVTISLIFIVTNTYFAATYPIIDEFNKHSFVLKLFYALIFTPCVLFFQITSFLSQVFFVKYQVKYKFVSDEERRKEYHRKMVRFETHAGLVSVLDCCLRAAPQLVVLFAIVLQDHGRTRNVSALQICSIIGAFVMMPWSITSFQGALRMEQQNIEVSYTTKAIYFLWHFFIMVARITSISGAVASWPVLTGTLVLLHCIGATFWLWGTTKPLKFCNRKKSWFFLFCCVFGGVYVFFPINLVKKPTFWKHFCFYLIVFVENLAANVAWIFHESVVEDWQVTFVVANQTMFFIGIFFMVIYYIVFHPTKSFLDMLVIGDEDEQESDNVPLNA